jgi:hypothetical protein
VAGKQNHIFRSNNGLDQALAAMVKVVVMDTIVQSNSLCTELRSPRKMHGEDTALGVVCQDHMTHNSTCLDQMALAPVMVSLVLRLVLQLVHRLALRLGLRLALRLALQWALPLEVRLEVQLEVQLDLLRTNSHDNC